MTRLSLEDDQLIINIDGFEFEAEASNSYAVGDTGPAGGRVFFSKADWSNTVLDRTNAISGGPLDGVTLNGSDYAISLTAEELALLPFDYLEAAPSNWYSGSSPDPKRPYESQSGDEIAVNDDGIKIGDGIPNTGALVAHYSPTSDTADNNAALAADAAVIGDFLSLIHI